MKRIASAVWNGSLKEGQGRFSVDSGAIRDLKFSFRTRFESEPGTNPEELIAAAHAGCFSMALAFQLSGAGHPPESIHTEARLSMEQVPDGWKIAAVHLVLRAKVPGIDRATFEDLAGKAKAGCPVSKVLNAAITLDATLE
jgi:osmotically inducible protein OsmC